MNNVLLYIALALLLLVTSIVYVYILFRVGSIAHHRSKAEYEARLRNFRKVTNGEHHDAK